MGLPDTPVWRHVEAIRMIMTMTTSEIDQAAATYLRDEPPPFNPVQGFAMFMLMYFLIVGCVLLVLPRRWTERVIPTCNR